MDCIDVSIFTVVICACSFLYCLLEEMKSVSHHSGHTFSGAVEIILSLSLRVIQIDLTKSTSLSLLLYTSIYLYRYLWKSKSAGVHDYLCNRLYSLPPERLEPYLVELVRLATLWPGSSLERCVIDLCRRSLRIALKVRWLLVASAESVPPNPHVQTVIQACTEASTKGKWPAPFRNLSIPSDLIENVSVSYDQETDSNGCESQERGSDSEDGDVDSQDGNSNASEDSENRTSNHAEEKSIFQRLWWSSSSPDLRASYEEELAAQNDDDKNTHEQDTENAEAGVEPENVENVEGGGKHGRKAHQEYGGMSNGEVEDDYTTDPQLERKGSETRERSLSTAMRQDTFCATIDFIFALCETSSELAAIADREWRKTVLQAAIEQLNEELAVTEITTGPAFPMGRIARVIHIVADEAILLNSRDRAPLLLYMEVLEVPESNSETESGSKSMKGDGEIHHHHHHSHHRNHSWSPSVHTLNGMTPAPESSDRSPKRSLNFNATGPIHRHSSVSNSNKIADVPHEMDWNFEKTPQEQDFQYDTSKIESASYPSSPELVTNMVCMPMDQDHVSKKIDRSLSRMNAVMSNRVQVKLKVKNSESSRFQFFPSSSEEGGEVEVQLHVMGHQRVSSHEALLNMAKQHKKPIPNEPQGRPLSPPKIVSPSKLNRSLSPWREQAAAEAAIRAQARAVLGERFEQKKARIKRQSAFGSIENWNVRAIIVKSGDDCRQESLATQLINHFHAIFKESNLPLWLMPYEILVVSSRSALIEVIPDALSIDTIKKRFPGKTLNEFFGHKFTRGSEDYRRAQKNFVESLAAYSLVTYFLQIKDRHNGNMMIDDQGHLIHIDFGFMLSNSPGGVNFETAPFKLTRELLEVMGSDADGVGSEPFDYFKVLVVQGFLAARKHADRIILLIEMMLGVGCPCFKGGQRVLQGLRRRFQPSLTEERCIEHVLGLIGESLDNWRTRQYDYYQRVLNGIL